MLLMLLFLLQIIPISVLGRCPDMEEVPVYYPGTSQFLCAVQFPGIGHELPVNGCNKCSAESSDQSDSIGYYYLHDGHEMPGMDGYYFQFGSVIVRPGCTLYLFEHFNYAGSYNVFESGVHPKVEGPIATSQCANAWTGFKCYCHFETITCQPHDDFELVIQCDNTDSDEDIECNYMKTIGVTFDQDVAASIAFDESIESIMRSKFWSIFESQLGKSNVTGYDWTEPNNFAVENEQSIPVLTEVKPGFILQVHQAIGKCDASVARTDLFKFTYIHSGQVVKEEISTFRDINN